METWKEWHEDNRSNNIFTVFYFVAFPMVSWIFICFAVLYYNDAAPNSRTKKVAAVYSDPETTTALMNEYKFHFQNEFILSSVAVLIAFIMSIGAACAVLQTGMRENRKVAELYHACSLCYVLPFILLCLDGIVFVAFSACIVVSLCRYCWCKRHRLKNADEFILIEDDHIALENILPSDNSTGMPGSTLYLSHQPPCDLSWWKFFSYSMIFPLCCLANHLHYITIAFVADLRHATATAIIYGVGFIFFYATLYALPFISSSSLMACCCCCCTSQKKRGVLLVKIILMAFLSIYVVTAIALHFVIPSDSGFEDAVTNIVTVSNTATVFFTAVVTYLVIKRPSASSSKESPDKEKALKDDVWLNRSDHDVSGSQQEMDEYDVS